MGDIYRDWNDEDRFGHQAAAAEVAKARLPLRSECKCQCHAPNAQVAHAGMCCTPDTAPTDDWTPDPRTVRRCIEVLRDHDVFVRDVLARDALEALLPKPDPAEALVEDFHKADDAQELPGSNMADRAIRWLIETGRVKP